MILYSHYLRITSTTTTTTTTPTPTTTTSTTTTAAPTQPPTPKATTPESVTSADPKVTPPTSEPEDEGRVGRVVHFDAESIPDQLTPGVEKQDTTVMYTLLPESTVRYTMLPEQTTVLPEELSTEKPDEIPGKLFAVVPDENARSGKNRYFYFER